MNTLRPRTPKSAHRLCRVENGKQVEYWDVHCDFPRREASVE